MITVPAGVRIYLACGVTGTRKGFDGLSMMAQDAPKQDPFSGTIFCFRGRRGHLVKVLYWDGQGFCLFAKRLEKGRFTWPATKEVSVTLTPAQMSMLLEGLTCAMGGCHMGITAENIASRFNVSRDEQDAYAAESQRRAEAAVKGGLFKEEIVPVQIPQKKGDPITFDMDEYPRAGTTADKLAGLKAAFKKDGTVTAGNASGINDGAAAVVVATAERAAKLGRKPLAKILSFASTGVDPAIMGMGPVSAVTRALERAKLQASDIDLFELNEAFAVQAVAVLKELKLDASKVNTRGGAIALGHPIGASGARVLTTLIYALRQKGGGRGVASLCIGGGMGIAMVIEV